MKRTEAEVRAFLEANSLRMITNPTKAEAKLWPHLERLGFERQVPLISEGKPVICDFLHFQRVLCIEIDGSVHRRQKGRDQRRDRRLWRGGIRTLRFTNNDILKHLDRVLSQIEAALLAPVEEVC